MLIIPFNLTLSGKKMALLLYYELTKTQKRDMTLHKPTIRKRAEMGFESRTEARLPPALHLMGSQGAPGQEEKQQRP